MRRRPIHGVDEMYQHLRATTANAYQLVGVAFVGLGAALFVIFWVAKVIMWTSSPSPWLQWLIMSLVGVGGVLVGIGVWKEEFNVNR